MKKVSLVLVALLCITMFSFTASAKEIDKNLGESVYGSDQKAVADAMNKIEKIKSSLEAHQITVVTGSIMPIFEADLIDYARTGEFEFSPKMSGNAQRYIAKAIAPGGEFAGNIEFTIEGESPRIRSYTPTAEYTPPGNDFGENSHVISYSFADHKRRIEKLVGKTVSPEEVRFVKVNALGSVFYFNDGKKEAFIAVDGANGDIFNNDNGGIVYFDEYLKEKAQEELKKEEKQKTELASLKPGENISTGGDGDYNTFAINPADVDHIIDTPDTVNVQKGNKNIITTNENQIWLYVGLSSIVVLLIAAGVILVFIRRRKTDDIPTP